jgi:mannan endo-1,4-beta-mannosidase
MNLFYQLALTTAIGLTLTACGGGSGNTKSTPTPVVTATSSSSSSLASAAPSSSSSTATTSSSSSAATSTLPFSLTLPASVDAGKDQTVITGASVMLNAAIVGDAPGPLSYQWTQISGASITLSGNTSANASFTAPAAASPFIALFKATVTDKNGVSRSDNVAVAISAATNRYEAEDTTITTLANGAKIDNTLTAGRSGTGYVNGFTNENPDAILTWNIAIAEAAYYKIDLGFQLGDSPKGFDFTIDNTTQLSGMMTATDKNFHATSLGAAPVDPAANAKTKILKKYINDNYTHTTLSGQQNLAEMDTVFARTGQRPAIYAIDLLNYSSLAIKGSGSAPASEVENFIAKVKNDNGKTHIASLIWHWHSPVDAKSIPCVGTGTDMNCWWNSFYTAHTNIDLTAVLADPTSDKYKALIADIDLIAVQLKKVEAAGIPVLWRPLHEADGAWFWWGAKGPESFKKLWRIMYDRLTNYHQIHNLIWVLTNETPSWYPGDDVVDVVGIDAYPTDKHDTSNVIWEKMMERYDGHKIIALTEFGGVPFINEMQAKGVWWAWFASWGDGDGSNPLGPKKMTPEELNAIYNSAEVISLDELNIPTQ